MYPSEGHQSDPLAEAKRSQSVSESFDLEKTSAGWPRDGKSNSCGICAQDFKSSSDFSSHLKVHLDEKVFKCPFCLDTLACDQTLRYHVNDAHNRPDLYHWISTKFRCRVCGQTLPFHLRQKHMRNIHFGLSCKICSKEFKNYAGLDAHAKTDHPNENIFSCPMCNKTFGVTKHCREHFEKVHEKIGLRGKEYPRKGLGEEAGKRFLCGVCQKWLMWCERISHMEEAHLGENSRSCERCSRDFKTLTDLDAHAQSDHPDEKIFSCPICHKTFALTKNRREHLSKIHLFTNPDDFSDERGSGELGDDVDLKKSKENYFCEICSTNFQTLPELNVHNRKTHPENIMCTICGKKFSSQKVLKRHTDFVHNKSRRCRKCGQEFGSVRQFEQHMREDHYEESGHNCQICSKAFSSSAYLLRHQTVHTTEKKKFECSPCGLTYASADTLSHHKRRIHKGQAFIRAFKCSACDKAFSAKERLRDHVELTHEGVRNHLCHICSKALGSKGTLKSHIERIHFGEKTPSKKVCEFCGKAYSSRTHFFTHMMRRHPQQLKFSCQFCERKFTSDHQLKSHARVKHFSTLIRIEPAAVTAVDKGGSDRGSSSCDNPTRSNTNDLPDGREDTTTDKNVELPDIDESSTAEKAEELEPDSRNALVSDEGPQLDSSCDIDLDPLDVGPKPGEVQPQNDQPPQGPPMSIDDFEAPSTMPSARLEPFGEPQPSNCETELVSAATGKLFVYNSEHSPQKMSFETFVELKKTLAAEFAFAILLKSVGSNINCGEVTFNSDHSCVVISCYNRESMAWFKEKISHIKLEGLRFRAWEEEELPKTVSMKLTLPDTFDQLEHPPIEAAIRHFNADSCDLFRIRSETRRMSDRVLDVEVGPILNKFCRQNNWTLNFLMGSIRCEPVDFLSTE